MVKEGQSIPTTVSIHAPRTGGDLELETKPSSSNLFQSTPPARGATRNDSGFVFDNWVSIHAPRTGGDRFSRK